MSLSIPRSVLSTQGFTIAAGRNKHKKESLIWGVRSSSLKFKEVFFVLFLLIRRIEKKIIVLMKRALQENEPSPLGRLAVRAVLLFSRYWWTNLWKAGFPLQTVMCIYHSQRTARGPWATMLYGFLFSVLRWSWTKVRDGKTEDNLFHIRTSLSYLSSAVAEQCWKSRALILQVFCEVVILFLIGCFSS